MPSMDEKKQEENLIGIPYLDEIVDINPVSKNPSQNSDDVETNLVIAEEIAGKNAGKSSSEDSGIL